MNFGQPFFEYSNNILQSIGNLQLPQSARLLLFLWPIRWFANALAAKVASYLIIAGIVFLAAYGLARLLSQSPTVALTAGWILGFLTTPFVPRLFFYEILAVAPAFVVIVAAPVVGFWLVSQAGRSSLLADLAIAVGLVALAFYLLAAASLALPILAAGMAIYVVLALALARRRSELLRKLAVNCGGADRCNSVTVALVRAWPVLGHRANLFPTTLPSYITTKTLLRSCFRGINLVGPDRFSSYRPQSARCCRCGPAHRNCAQRRGRCWPASRHSSASA